MKQIDISRDGEPTPEDAPAVEADAEGQGIRRAQIEALSRLGVEWKPRVSAPEVPPDPPPVQGVAVIIG